MQIVTCSDFVERRRRWRRQREFIEMCQSGSDICGWNKKTATSSCVGRKPTLAIVSNVTHTLMNRRSRQFWKETKLLSQAGLAWTEERKTPDDDKRRKKTKGNFDWPSLRCPDCDYLNNGRRLDWNDGDEWKAASQFCDENSGKAEKTKIMGMRNVFYTPSDCIKWLRGLGRSSFGVGLEPGWAV